MWRATFSAETAAVSKEQQQLSDPAHSRTLTPPPHGGEREREEREGVSDLTAAQACPKANEEKNKKHL